MEPTNRDSRGRHPAAGGGRRRRERAEAEVVDLATERALRLLAQAGMIAAAPVPQRRGTVR